MKSADPKNRFTSKVKNYIRYRPTYPEAFYNFLVSELELSHTHRIADIGSGPGLSCKWLIQNGNPVYGIEPNTEMRLAAEYLFQQYPNFNSLDGSAEETNLPDKSVDFILIGQAFHWFDREKARQELQRILKPNGYIVITWNERLTETSFFLKQFENLLIRYSSDYLTVDHRNITDEMLSAFFGHTHYHYHQFYNCQLFNWEGLKGRLFSMSYAPDESEGSFEKMMDELAQLYRKNAFSGQVKFDYLNRVYYGRII